MKLAELKTRLHVDLFAIMSSHIAELRPCQSKSIEQGLLEGRSLLVCTPTASGKTLVAEMAGMMAIIENRKKAVYIAPLKALVKEKYDELRKKYPKVSFGLSIGDMDKEDSFLRDKQFIFCTAEKLDSLIRHRAAWLKEIGCIVIDEIHLLDDPGRGPTLEIIITLIRELSPQAQLIGLSATIGNAEELADWLRAGLVVDDWRPVKLRRGIMLDSQIDYFEKD